MSGKVKEPTSGIASAFLEMNEWLKKKKKDEIGSLILSIRFQQQNSISITKNQLYEQKFIEINTLLKKIKYTEYF